VTELIKVDLDDAVASSPYVKSCQIISGQCIESVPYDILQELKFTELDQYKRPASNLHPSWSVMVSSVISCCTFGLLIENLRRQEVTTYICVSSVYR